VPGGAGDIVVCSLEEWDDVWRRNQFFVDWLLREDSSLRVLFVEPAVDLPFEIAHRRWPAGTGLRQVTDGGRLWARRPTKLLPRLVAPGMVERHLIASVLDGVARLRLSDPLLWVNDASYAALAREVDWPVVYDVTDDWLEGSGTARELARLHIADASLLERAEEVVVVSSALEKSRGARRAVHLIANAVDEEHFRTPMARPADLPRGPVAVYVGTQHDGRLDVPLCIETARAIAPAKLVFVGPNCLGHESTRKLLQAGSVLLGRRPYQEVPAYYQHADVIVVPHPVNSFTESLDPIKGYECIAVGRPTLSTAVAGMRDLGPPVEICSREQFPTRVKQLVEEGRPSRPGSAPTWAQRAGAFAAVLQSARRKRAGDRRAGAGA